MARQVWRFEPSDRWVRATLEGETVADSKRAMLMIESRGELDYRIAEDQRPAGLLAGEEQADSDRCGRATGVLS